MNGEGRLNRFTGQAALIAVDLAARYWNHAGELDELVELRQRLIDGDQSPAPTTNEPDGWAGRDPSQRRRVAERLPAGALDDLVERYRAGTPLLALVEQFGISASTVKRILRRAGARHYRAG